MRPDTSSAHEGRRQRVVLDRQGGQPGGDAASSVVLRRCPSSKSCGKGQQHSGRSAAPVLCLSGHSRQPGRALQAVLALRMWRWSQPCSRCTVLISISVLSVLLMLLVLLVLRHGMVPTAQNMPSSHGPRPAAMRTSGACQSVADASGLSYYFVRPNFEQQLSCSSCTPPSSNRAASVGMIPR